MEKNKITKYRQTNRHKQGQGSKMNADKQRRKQDNKQANKQEQGNKRES